MKKSLFLTFFMALFFSFSAWSQLGQIGLVGTINDWKAPDHKMTRDLDNPLKYSTIIIVDTNATGDIEVKFRENESWGVNWGGVFPSGTGIAGGDNIVVPERGTYFVTFEAAISNDTVVTYNFTKTYGTIGLVGNITGWGAKPDLLLTRSTTALDEYYGQFSLLDTGTIEVKFRENQGWAVNWGSSDGFPTGTGVQDGANLVVPAGNYAVSFNTTTGAYNFISTVGEVGMIGEFNGWSADHWMTRNASDPDKFSTIISFVKDQDTDNDAIVEAKFRENAGWAVNWGAIDFPSGVATNNGANILVPIDTLKLTNDFVVNFEYIQVSGTVSNAIYSFTPASGVISMIGEFNNWAGDFPMNRDAVNPNIWTATRSWYADSKVKFRENHDWNTNWGAATFPTGTGTPNGADIPLVAGTYDITFNAATSEYSFVDNASVVGEIGLVGEFTEWGIQPDINMVRDAIHPNYFTLTYNFGSSTQVLFRENSDESFLEVWGGTFPSGTGVKDVNQVIDVPGGLYYITFDANSGDFYFKQLGNSLTAPKVFAMNINGSTTENDWTINQPVSKVVDGTATTPAEVTFGLTYNDEYLYVGINVANATQTDDVVHIFVDGNKSGGAYDNSDVYFTIAADGTVEVIEGATGVTPVGKVATTSTTSYSVEASIKWSELGVTAVTGTQKGFDIIFADGETYKLAWNGGLGNLTSLSLMGDVLLGQLSCGTISLYNSTIGDVVLRNTVAAPTDYTATYNLDVAGGVQFRKDLEGTVTWGDDAWKEGTATVGGPQIPATVGRYTIAFNCLSGAYKFTDKPAAAASTAYAKYVETEPVIDGTLSEYTLDYGSSILVAGANPNNTVTWGISWDKNNLYFGAKVVDAVVDLAAAGSPWQNDAIEIYIDGDNSKDGAYSAGSFDTQLIMDVVSNNAAGIDGVDAMWTKADGVPITNYNSKWLTTATGYNVEIRLGWNNFGFAPGKGRTMGFSMGNDDRDISTTDRDYQTVWYGTDAVWSNNSLLGDLELADGPYFFVGIFENKVLNNANIQLFPNPTQGNVFVKTLSEEFNGNVTVNVFDITGKVVASTSENIYGANSLIEVNTSNLTKGLYLVNILGNDGQKAVKKLIIQ
ncbi:MAG: sugar-binding protein [Salinivirgaceae bacterium]